MNNNHSISEAATNDKETPTGEDVLPPVVITELDGDTPHSFSSCRGAWSRGRTACGNYVDFYSKFHWDWTVSLFSIGSDGRENTSHVVSPQSPKGGLSIDLLRGFSSVNITFSPDALLPFAIDDPVALESLLRDGANPNRIPPMLPCPDSALRGRPPLVLLDELIMARAAAITDIYKELPDVEISPVSLLEKLTGIPSGRVPVFRNTHIHSSLEHHMGKLRKLHESRMLLIQAGAFEVSDFFRAVRTHFFDVAEKFPADGLPVDVLQSAGCTMLTESILTKDHAAIEWLLKNGANPNFLPHPSDVERENAVDMVPQVRELDENPRLIQKQDLLDLLRKVPFAAHLNALSNELGRSLDPKVHPSRYQPVVAALLSDNRPAFEKLIEHGADINACAIFQRIIPPDWAFPRLAELGIDWLQTFGRQNRRCAVNIWQCLQSEPACAHGLDLWRKFAPVEAVRQAKESWAQLLEDLPGQD